MKKKILTFIICILLLFMNRTGIYAKGDTLSDDAAYHVVNVEKNGTYDIIKSYDSYAEAKVAHTLLKRNYNNLGITYGASFLTIEQGIVEFQTAKDCSLNTSYIIDENNKEGYTNGCYGIDAAFLEYNTATQKVKFKLSGIVGWAKASEVTILPIEKVPSISSFHVKDNKLYHDLKSSLAYKDFDNSLLLSDAPSYLKNDKTYYSYDTHYFYTSYAAMIEDYRNNNYKQAVNEKEPYFNYYQYMNHRSTSNYTVKDLDTYLKDTLAINQTITSFQNNGNYLHDILTQSLLPQARDAFFQYQNQFGANALMMLSLSLNESAIGRSYLAFTKNNLFGHAAFDSAAEENASRYASVSNSIYAHALQYISNAYLNPKQFQFHGGYFGNKAGGMNISYASDPYWGEKAAQYYYEMDNAMGKKDNNQYALGISLNKKVSVYKEASKKSDVIYTTNKGYESSFILLEKITNKDGTWYRVQSDPALNSKKEIQNNTTYNFKESYGYIHSDDVTTVLNTDKITQRNYVNITFDANGGNFYPNDKSITLQVENGKTPAVLAPVKENALFNGWDITLGPAKANLTYKATYKKVKQIRLTKNPLTTYEINDTLDVKNGVITIDFADGSTKDVNLTTDMVAGYNAKKEGKQVLSVAYAGTKTNYEITVSKSKEEKRRALQERAAYIIKTYTGKIGLKEESINELKQFQKDIADAGISPLNNDQVRIIDRIFQENLKPRYSTIIKDSTYDTQISGLSLALQGESGFLNSFMPKTIVMQVSNQISKEEEVLAKKVAKANHVTYEGAFHVSGKNDFSSLKLKQDIVFSIQKPKGTTEHKLYRIYYIDGDDVYQLPTTQSTSRILFSNNKLGSYVIVSQNAKAISKTFDFTEVNTIRGNGKNYITRYILLPAAFLVICIIAFISYHVYRKKHPRKWKLKRVRYKGKKKSERPTDL